jgi:hypothetical protein
MMATPSRQIPNRLNHALTNRDHLIPTTHHNVLLAGMQKELIANLKRSRLIGAQNDMGFV